MEIGQTTSPVTSSVVVKNILYIPAFLLGMEMHSFTILLVFIIVDMITGIWRVGVTKGGQEIKSAHAINGLVSKLLFALIPLVIAYSGKGIGVNLIDFAKGSLSVLILATAYSIIGNIYTIRTGEYVKEFDAVRLILSAFRKLLDSSIPQGHK